MSVGTFYVILLSPELHTGRVKLGWSINVGHRLSTHRTVAPSAVLLRGWACNRSWERAAIVRLTSKGCVALSREVFDVEDVSTLLKDADEFFSQNRIEPLIKVTASLGPIDNPLSSDQIRSYSAILGSLPKTKVERECVVCGKKFVGTRRAKYCSRAHASKAWRGKKKAEALGVEPAELLETDA